MANFLKIRYTAQKWPVPYNAPCKGPLYNFVTEDRNFFQNELSCETINLGVSLRIP